jgi:hypothetical protein
MGAMDFQSTLEWQRVNADKISRLAKFGDKLAARLIVAYRELYADQLNPLKQSEWMKICDDYCRRDLTIVTRVLLQDRYGHKAPKQLRRLDS